MSALCIVVRLHGQPCKATSPVLGPTRLGAHKRSRAWEPRSFSSRLPISIVCVWFPANRHYSCSVWHTVCYEKGSEDFSSCHFCQHFHDPEDPLFFAKKGCHRYLASPFQHFGSQFGPLSLAPFLCFEEIRSPRAMQHL